jgi:hypothetical protein
MKYTIELVEGCTAFDTIINGVSITDISKEEQEQLVDYLFDQLRESYKTGEISLDSLIKNFQYDDYEYDSEPCEQCGDTVSTTIYKI